MSFIFLMSVSFICLYQTLRSFFTVIPLLLHKPEKKNTRLWLTFHVLGSLSYIVSCRWGYKGSISRHHSNVTIAWNTFLCPTATPYLVRLTQKNQTLKSWLLPGLETSANSTSWKCATISDTRQTFEDIYRFLFSLSCG